MTHAKYGSPSSLYRSAACPGWVEYTKDLPDGAPSIHAEEGTAFHEVMEIMFQQRVSNWIDDSNTCVDIYRSYPEMRNTVNDTLFEVVNRWDKFRSMHYNARYHVELRVHLTQDIFGTADLVFVGEDKKTGQTNIVVIDYKHGLGVHVQAQNNLQGLAYLLGAIETLQLKNIGRTIFIIAQVRLEDGWSLAEYDKEELDNYREKILSIVDKVKAVCNGEIPLENNLHPGSHCRWCKADGLCVAQKRETFDMVESTAMELPIEARIKHLTLDQQVAIFLRKTQIEDFLNAVAMNVQRTLESGVTHPDVKIVETNGRRGWKDSVTPEDLKQLGVSDPTTVKISLKGIGEVEKAVGKGKIDHLVVVGGKKREVVHVSDKRSAVIGLAPAELPE